MTASATQFTNTRVLISQLPEGVAPNKTTFAPSPLPRTSQNSRRDPSLSRTPFFLWTLVNTPAANTNFIFRFSRHRSNDKETR